MHLPVMLEEVISSLDLKEGDVVLDATVGGGGHAKEIIARILPGGRLIGLDADSLVLDAAGDALKDFSGHFKLINDNFRNLDEVLAREGVGKLDAAFFDLGVSSYQLDDGMRGFSIRHDGRLDMRMDVRQAKKAYDIVNRYNEKKISELIGELGEERFHNRIAKYIVEARARRPIETTRELVEIVHKAVGHRYGKTRIDPATRTFQALRIAVNDELGSLEEGLKKAVPLLKENARICVISFHSLEDRIVKNIFRDYSKSGFLKLVTKKPMVPSSEEAAMNPRSRSAKLRAAERIV